MFINCFLWHHISIYHPVHWFPSEILFSSYLWHFLILTYFILLSFLVFHIKKCSSQDCHWQLHLIDTCLSSPTSIIILKTFSSLGFHDIIPLSFLPHLWFSSSVWNWVVRVHWWISLLQRNSMYFWIYLCIYHLFIKKWLEVVTVTSDQVWSLQCAPLNLCWDPL